MCDFSDKNQITLIFAYEYAPLFNSSAVRSDHEIYDPLRVLEPIECLKRKWFRPAAKFRVFQQYLPETDARSIKV